MPPTVQCGWLLLCLTLLLRVRKRERCKERPTVALWERERERATVAIWEREREADCGTLGERLASLASSVAALLV